jgi:O-acetylserine/cysteine efflux transporter
MSGLEVAAALLVALVWGVQFVTSKYGVDVFPPLLFLTLRFATVGLLLLPFAGRPTRREIAIAAVVSVFFGGLCFGLFFVGLHLGLAGLSAVIVQLMTPFTVLFAWLLLGERPPLRIIIGVVVAFAGVALALASPGEAVPAVAVLLVMGGAASQALGNVLIKRFGPFQPMRFMAWLSLFTVPQVGVASAVFETGQETALRNAKVLAWLALGYGVLFGAVIGFGLWFWLIGRCSLARVAPFALLSTVFAIGAGILFLHEKVSGPLLAGASICIAGVVLTQAGANGDKTTAKTPVGTSNLLRGCGSD